MGMHVALQSGQILEHSVGGTPFKVVQVAKKSPKQICKIHF